jgi:teichuronic acid biosynthesis glycosyltransferase TuaC
MPNQFRLLVVSHAYPRRSVTSHGSFIHKWNVGLRECGIDVTVLQLAQWSPPWPVSEIDRSWRDGRRERADMVDELDGIPIHHPSVFSPRPSRFFPGDPWDREARTLISYCRRGGLGPVDAVIGHFMVPDGYHALRLGEALGVPVAAVAWGDDVHAWPAERPYWRRRLGEVLHGVDAPVACSHRLAQDANQWLDVARDDWQIVYGGVDHTKFRPPADKAAARLASHLPQEFKVSDAKLILTLGPPIRAKGYLELLDAWSAVAPTAPDWQLVMGGVASAELDIAAEVRERRLEGRAHWIGLQPAHTVSTLLQACDAFVLASHNEGLSLSVLEAMATGLPTIATDVGGHAEVITTPAEGWLIPARDVAALTRSLRELTSSPDARTLRGTAGRRAALRIGTPAENAARLAERLRSLAAEHRHTQSQMQEASR